ncbi:MAG: hypothetical protein NW215_13540 [Hyphomicrobiales bacterium]|nr:hypothetical protein [Hyphomicrobiales bacterium]
MRISPQLPLSVPADKIKKIVVKADGSTEYVLGAEKASGLLDFKKAAAFGVGSSAYMTTGYLKSASTSEIAAALNKKLWIVKPENGFDALAGQLKGVAEQTHMRYLAVSASAGLVSWALLDSFTSLSASKKIALAAAFAAATFAVLQVYQPDAPKSAAPAAAPSAKP